MKLPLLLVSVFLAAAALPARPARAESNLYEIKKTEPKVATGAKGTASVTIATKGGWHMNAEAPIRVTLKPPAGISLTKPELERGDLAVSTAESARFDIPFAATEAGRKVINAQASFVICQESACKPVKETLALNIEVTPPTAAPTAKPKKHAQK
jgi:hypothetical protein